MAKIDFKLKIVSPIFIGSGNKLTPLNYIIKGNFLYKIKESAFIKYLLEDDKNRFMQIIDSDNIGNINRYYLDKFDVNNKNLYFTRLSVTTELSNKYNSIIGSYDNQGLIDEFITNSLSGKPYIPGSTLKGSFRTAILTKLLQHQKINPDAPRDIEMTLLKALNDQGNPSIPDDPFKNFKIGDMNFSQSLKVSKSENVKPGRNSKIPEFREILMPSENIISGQISVHKDFISYFSNKLNSNISDMKNFLIECLNEFYQPVLTQDKAFFSDMRGFGFTNISTKLETAMNTINKSIIRVGKGQGTNSFSIKNHSSLTRNVVENMPFGWCEIEFSE
jgi:CRISPR-associated protein Csm5